MRTLVGSLATLVFLIGIGAIGSLQSQDRTRSSRTEADTSSSPEKEETQRLQAVQVFTGSAGEEGGAAENSLIFSSSGDAARAREQMSARLADSEQRLAVRAEQRASIQQLYPDLAQVVSLDTTTHDKLIDLLTDQQMNRLDEAYGERRRNTPDSLQMQADAETRNLDALRELLGEEGLERYQQYLSTLGERSQVDQIDARLDDRHKLRPEQKDGLIALYKERNERDLAQDILSRAASRPLSSIYPDSQSLRADLAQTVQLQTLASNEELLRRMHASNRWLVQRAAGFLNDAQIETLSQMNAERTNSLQQWVEQARARAGLDPAIPERHETTTSGSKPARAPITGHVKLDITLRVNQSKPVTVTHTGPNGEPVAFQAADKLFVEATAMLFDDDWLEVQLDFFEQGRSGRRRLDTTGHFDVMTKSHDGSPSRGGGSMLVTGGKAYSIEASIGAEAG
ncbi:MAG: hypothetical protein ACREV5_07435 [Steroidobacter sp.]